MKHTDAKCTADKTWFVSCNNLLPHKSVKFCYYCISSFVLLLNIMSLGVQKLSFNRGFHKTVASLPYK